MNDENAFVDDEEDEPPADPAEVAAARNELERRCKDANIELRDSEGFAGEESVIEVGMPAARDKRWVYLFDLDDIRSLLAVPFEKYVFVGDYSAICSYSDSVIEAAIRPLSNYSPRLISRRLFPQAAKEGEVPVEELSITLSPEGIAGAPTIEIGPASIALKNLTRGLSGHRLSLRLSGVRVTQHDHALSLLEKIANSVFFQIDLLADIPLAQKWPHQSEHPAKWISCSLGA